MGDRVDGVGTFESFLSALSRFLALSPRRLSSHARSCPCLSATLNHLREDTECFISDPITMTLPLIPLRLDGPLDRKDLLKQKERASGVPFYWPHLDFLPACLYAPAITDSRCVD